MTAPSDKELKRLLANADNECVLPLHANDHSVQDDRGFNAAIAETEDLAQLLALAPELARELLAARKVVRAAKEVMQCTSFPEGVSDKWFTCEVTLLAALAAYDKARKG